MRRIGLIGALIAGCAESAAPGLEASSPSLDQPEVRLTAGGAPVQHLARLLHRADLDLSAGQSTDAHSAKPWPLNDWSKSAIADAPLWSHALPYALDQRSYAQQPPGLELRISGGPVTYKTGLVNGGADDSLPDATPHWEVRAGKIMVRGATALQPGDAVLLDSATNATLARRDYGLAGLPAHEFASMSIEKGLETRRSILLPAPASARFELNLPSDAQLVFGIGVDAVEHDTAPVAVRFEVLVDGTAVFSERATSSDDWSDHRIDLSAHASANATLELRTRAETDNHHAFAAFSSPVIVGEPSTGGPSRVVVIGLDTLRKDHVGVHGYARPVTPGMDQIAAQSVVFEEAWTPAPRTRPSFRSATTGRWPLAAVNAPTLGEVFTANGWSTAGFVANVQLAPRLGFADGFDTWSYDNMSDGDKQVDRTLAWLKRHESEDAFVFLHMMDPHIFYEAPEPYLDRYTDPYDNEGLRDRYNRWDINKRMASDRLSATQREWIKARYDGEIAFMDRELVRLVNGIDRLTGDTLIIFHTDHGEEFWEHGGFEHNHSLYNELVAAILWIRPPRGWGGGPHRINAPVSLVDIAPTIADLAGLDTTIATFDGVSLSPFVSASRTDGASALSRLLEDRPLPIGHMMFNREQWGVIHSDQKYILHTASGAEELYDLARDPTESANLADQQDTSSMQGMLSQATGWPVLSGWRLQFSGLPHPTTIDFQTPIGRAFILDPEVNRTRRANREWGEVPPVRAEDVATVAVNEDRTSLLLTPGTSPSGILFIEGLSAADRATATCSLGGSNLRPVGRSSICSRKATLTVGPLLAQDANAVQRDAPEVQTIDALRSLGYLD